MDHSEEAARMRHPYRLSDDETYRSRWDDLHDLGFDDDFIEKDALVSHLLHKHGVVVSTFEWQVATIETLRALDPCSTGSTAA